MHEPQWVYLNGTYVARDQAMIPVEDRGFLFAESVYEVVRVYNHVPFKLAPHAERLARSLTALGIAPGNIVQQLTDASHTLLERENFPDANLYWQVTRGLSRPRGFAFNPDTPPTVLAIAYPTTPLRDTGVPTASAWLTPDERWHNVHIKTTMLLPNNVAANQALDAGCDMALMHHDNEITEGNSSNFYAVFQGVIRTHPANGRILNGITRELILGLITDLGYTLDETPMSIPDMLAADEWFVSGSNTEVTAITRIVHDNKPHKKPVGPLTTALRRAFVQTVQAACPPR